MKVRILLAFALFGLVLSSCNMKYRDKPEDLAIDLIRALKTDNVHAAICLLPPKIEMNEIVNNYAGIFGGTFYNKYSHSYQHEALIAKINSDFEIVRTMTRNNGLDWNGVQMGNVSVENINTESGSYPRVSINLKFQGGTYLLQYNAVRSKSKGWFLGNDIYLSQPVQR